MTAQNLSKLTKNFGFAIVASIVIVTLAFISFILAEPQIGHSQATRDFTIQQTITGEATFLVDPTNIDMTGDINGITGGNATGTTGFIVQSNSAGGYYVTIDFGAAADTYNGVQYAMRGDATGSEDIFDYRYGSAEPGYGFTPEANASFAYTVAASSSSDVDPSFQHNNADTCNTGGDTTPGICWATPSSTPFRIVDSGAPTADTGASSTITFRVNVPSGATPTPSAETYTATATLSLFTQ